MSVIIKEVVTKKELEKFVKFNIDLYKDNPYQIPGLIEEEMVTHDREKNPAFEVCEATYFLAYKDGEIAGRIAGTRTAMRHGSKNAPALVLSISSTTRRWWTPSSKPYQTGQRRKGWKNSRGRWAIRTWTTRECW